MTTKLNPNDVCENPDLYPEEKETSIWFSRRDERATIHSDERGIVRRLLSHPESEVDPKSIERGNDGEIYSFYGTIPISCLKMLSVPRETGGHASVVSNYEQTATDE